MTARQNLNKRLKNLAVGSALALSVAGATPAFAAAYTVTLDTSAYSGIVAQLAFDFIDGGTPSNSVTISGFSTDGTLGSVSAIGGVGGTLPGNVTLSDSSFFNEYLANITLGNSVQFSFDATKNGPDFGSVQDAFSLFLLDASGLPLFATSDPSGADALMLLGIDGSGAGLLNSLSASARVVRNQIPEPTSLVLTFVGLTLLSTYRRRPRA